MSQKLTREQLINLVKKIINCEGSKSEIDKMIDVIEANVIHPAVTDLIFYPEDDNVTHESIVDEAMSYKSIQL